VAMPGLGTMGVTDRMVGLFDPAAVMEWSIDEVAGGLVHELLHPTNDHHARRLGRDPFRWNCACDRAINPMVIDAGFALPKGHLLPEQIGQPAGQPAESYYLHEPESPPGSPSQAAGGPGEPGGKGQEQGRAGPPYTLGAGHCGSGAGNPFPNEPEEADKIGRSDVDIARVRRQIAESIREAAAKSSKGVGSVPGSWQVWANVLLTPAKVPWQTELARTIRATATYRPGAVEQTWHHASRRQAGIGYGPGKPRLPALHWPRPQVAVAIDSSGSMGTDEFKLLMPEVDGVLRAIGANVDLLVCDAEVQNLRPVRKVADVAALLKGGGGTDFRPIFDALTQRRPRPEIVIVMTDGWGPAPAEPPAWTRVIWVLVGEGAHEPCTWGRMIKVE